MLHNSYPENFPYGHRGTVLADVIHEMLKFIDGVEVWTQSSEKTLFDNLSLISADHQKSK